MKTDMRKGAMKIELRPRLEEMLIEPEDEKMHYSEDGGRYPVWASCCQRRVTLFLPGLLPGQEASWTGKAPCPYCQFPYHLRLAIKTAKIKGRQYRYHTVDKVPQDSDWERWYARLHPPFDRQKSSQNRRKAARGTSGTCA